MSFMNQMAPKYVLAPRKKYLGASWLLEFLPNFEPCVAIKMYETIAAECGRNRQVCRQV